MGGYSKYRLLGIRLRRMFRLRIVFVFSLPVSLWFVGYADLVVQPF